MGGKCDKCGLPVEQWDDATFVSSYLPGHHAIEVFYSAPRHILCSPSRAQYIVPLGVADDRPEFDKRLKEDQAEVVRLEAEYTAAWQRLQQECDDPRPLHVPAGSGS